MRIKPLPPTLREKRRYLLVVGTDCRGVVRAVQSVFGKFYSGLAHIYCVESGLADLPVGGDIPSDGEQAKQIKYCIVRVRRDLDWLVRAALALYEFPVPVFVPAESGTLRALREKGVYSLIVGKVPQRLNKGTSNQKSKNPTEG